MSTALAYIATSQLIKPAAERAIIGPPIFIGIMLFVSFIFHVVLQEISDKELNGKLTEKQATDWRCYAVIGVIAIGVLVFALCVGLDHPG